MLAPLSSPEPSRESPPPITDPGGRRHGGASRREEEHVVLLDALEQNWVELGYRQELAAYHGACRWRSARTVLDARAGNGRYLSEIARRFPDKRYFGVESDRALLERALMRYAWQGIDLECLALTAVSGRYDAVILRSLVRMRPCTRATLDLVADVTNVGGSAFIIEPLGAQRHFEPTPRRVTEFLTAFDELHGPTAGAAQSLAPLARSHPAWNPSVTLDVVVPSTVADNLSLFEETYGLTFELAERTRTLRTDYRSLHEEWRWWCGQENRYTQAALRIIRLDRI
ncbi:MAG: class I SAM-dependent methyltransferase [Gammaproteobacteria bacterium]|nr:class I SAM-dependent methyltransferase [Gammaproteobacteria bacterium]